MDAFSIIIYLSTFLVSLIFIHFGNQMMYVSFRGDSRKGQFKFYGIICVIIGVLIPCILASVRDITVGGDVKAYVTSNFVSSKLLISNGFWYYFENMPKDTEIGFAYILYLGNIFNSLGLSFFLIELFIIIPVYIFLVKIRAQSSVTLGMATFYFLSYNFSLSGMRGSIAMSLLLLAYYYLNEKKYKVAIPIILLAILFHNSAILLSVLYFVIAKLQKLKYGNIVKIMSLSFIVVLFLFTDKILSLLVSIAGFASARYVFYLSTYIGAGSISDIPSTDLICKLALIAIIYSWQHKYKKYTFGNLPFLYFALIGRLFVLFNAIFYESMRIAFYFDMFLIPYAASIYSCPIKRKFDRCVVSTIVILPSFLYWLYFIMYKGGYVTNVFKFR